MFGYGDNVFANLPSHLSETLIVFAPAQQISVVTCMKLRLLCIFQGHLRPGLF